MKKEVAYLACARNSNGNIAFIGQCVLFKKDGGILAQADDALLQMLGYSREDWLERQNDRALCWIHPDDKDRIYLECADHFASGTPVKLEHRIVRADGVVRWVQMNGQRLNDREGDRIVAAYIDITELVSERERFQTLANTFSVGIVQYDLESGALEYTNGAYCTLYGENHVDPSRQPFANVHPEDADRTLSLFQQEMRQNGPLVLQYRILCRDRTARWIENHIHFCTGEDGKRKIQSFQVDISASKQAQIHLQTITNTIPGGVVQLALGKKSMRVLYANDGFYHLLGFSREEYSERTRDNPFYFIHPDDISKLLSLVPEKGKEEGWLGVVDYRQRDRDGEWRWRLLYAKRIDSEDPAMPVLQCIILDNDEKKRLELSLDLERERYRVVAQLSDGLLWEYDCASDELRVPYHNPGVLVNQAVTKGFTSSAYARDCVHPEDRGGLERYFQDLKTGKEQTVFEFRVKNEENAYCWYLSEGAALCNAAGKPVRVVGRITNIDQKKQESLRLQRAAERDPLTGLYNRRVAQVKIEEYLRNALSLSGCGLILLDVDNFKSVNDRLGRLFGDMLLINIAQTLKNQLRTGDILGRVGGDEFVLLLRRAHSRELMLHASSLCRSIRRVYSGELEETKLSVSIGLADSPRCGTRYTELFECADRALAHAKKMGKNQVALYDARRTVLPEGSRGLDLDEASWQPLPERHPGSLREMLELFSRILGTTKDFDSAAYLLLDRVGRICGARHAAILECSLDGTKLETSYLWDSRIGRSKLEEPECYYFENWPGFVESFNENGIYCVPRRELIPPKAREVLQVQALLQCGIYDGTQFRGCVSIDDVRSSHSWTQQEIHLLSEFTRAITPYILRRRASKEAQYKLDQAMNFDELTGLHTMTSLKTKVQKLLSREPYTQLATVYLDIIDFKFVNDIYGFGAGDEVLRDFAKLLTGLSGGYSSRLSDDSFVALLRFDTLKNLSERILESSRTFNRQQKEKLPHSNVLVAAGVCPLCETNGDLVTAIDNANIARKSVKSRRGSACAVFDLKMKHELSVEAEMSGRMEYALTHGEFLVYLQPKVSLSTGKMIGAEALVRWQTADGIIPPDDFIPFFEKNGFVTQLDFYVLRQVLKHMKTWYTQGRSVVPVSVNLSRLHGDTAGEAEQILRMTREFGIGPEKIELELTETAFFQDAERLRRFMQELMSLGFHMSIDDFGSGYSSLNILPTIPANILKLDKEFLRNHGDRERSRILVRHMVSMAQELNFSVICEGVETVEDVQFLRSVGCDAAQGYYFARPIPIPEFEKTWLDKAQ